MPSTRLPLLCVVVAAIAWSTDVRAAEKVDISVRGKTLTLTIYPSRTRSRGTILMGSGDVGWVGLAASMAEELATQGYLVVGINVRQYLAAFTSGAHHLQATDRPGDYRLLVNTLKQTRQLESPIIVSGVSEGAALAVLASADPSNHAWIDGVITMGLPPTAELAWRWTDVGSWITKRDADEPSFAAKDVIATVSPVPLCMIQSTRDEYVPQSEWQRLLATAREPKKQILIDASNHRFTDKRPELSAAYQAGLAWIAQSVQRKDH
ncbi:MAG: alpha/beta hydrolase family protein [Vicinamibacterales bacterium]